MVNRWIEDADSEFEATRRHPGATARPGIQLLHQRRVLREPDNYLERLPVRGQSRLLPAIRHRLRAPGPLARLSDAHQRRFSAGIAVAGRRSRRVRCSPCAEPTRTRGPRSTSRDSAGSLSSRPVAACRRYPSTRSRPRASRRVFRRTSGETGATDPTRPTRRTRTVNLADDPEVSEPHRRRHDDDPGRGARMASRVHPPPLFSRGGSHCCGRSPSRCSSASATKGDTAERPVTPRSRWRRGRTSRTTPGRWSMPRSPAESATAYVARLGKRAKGERRGVGATGAALRDGCLFDLRDQRRRQAAEAKRLARALASDLWTRAGIWQRASRLFSIRSLLPAGGLRLPRMRTAAAARSG